MGNRGLGRIQPQEKWRQKTQENLLAPPTSRSQPDCQREAVSIFPLFRLIESWFLSENPYHVARKKARKPPQKHQQSQVLVLPPALLHAVLLEA
jgi:hypothetical protein